MSFILTDDEKLALIALLRRGPCPTISIAKVIGSDGRYHRDFQNTQATLTALVTAGAAIRVRKLWELTERGRIAAALVMFKAPKHADAGTIDIRSAGDGFKIKAMGHLIAALETTLKITKARHYQDVPEPEPFPGACEAVINQSLAGIQLARIAGLIQ